jgi:hypothetical protein
VWRATGAGDQAVGQDRRAVSHPAYLHRQRDHDGDQTHAEPVEQDHAVANPRGLIAIEGGDLLRGHGWRHRVKEARKQEEATPNDRQYGQCPEKDQLTISASHRRPSQTLVADRNLDGSRSATKWSILR